MEAERIRSERFTADHDGDAVGLVRRAWDLDLLGRSYVRWLADAEDIVAVAGTDPSDEEAFAVRSRLVHEWRKFLFTDPGLPRVLLPEGWPGVKAAEFFDAESNRLLPAAGRFVDECLSAKGER